MLQNRHSVFPFDCSANCWGAGDVSVYLKADRSNYAQSRVRMLTLLYLPSATMLRALTTDVISVFRAISISCQVFLYFSFSHSFRRNL